MTPRRILPTLVLAALALAGSALAQPLGQTFTPGPFDKLVISGAAQVELTQGDRDQVTLVGTGPGVDGHRMIRLRLDNGRLDVFTHDDWKFWSRDAVQLKVQMREISQVSVTGLSDLVAPRPIRADALRVSISGKGDVKFSDLTARQLRFDVSGAGDGELAGKVDDLQVNLSGKGDLLADRLKAARAVVVISGVASANVWVTDSLRMAISGVGTVDYWGQPKVQAEVSRMSEVRARGDRK